MDDEKIIFTSDDGDKIEFYVIEEAKLNGTNYLLVSESDEGDGEMAYILKQIENPGDKDLAYEFVEDEKEVAAVAGLLEELLDGEVKFIPEDE